MDPWSNIDTSPQDIEIVEIDKFEKDIGYIPASVMKIRELITRFEICHFKYREHLIHIQDSILNLEPTIDLNKIGFNHISKGENAWKNDKTGRSLIGQQYLWALEKWLAISNHKLLPENNDEKLELKIRTGLGNKTIDKERIIRLLIARLTYDWEGYEKHQLGGKFKDLENQACRMDICHYAFPKHIDNLIQSIGKMEADQNQEGCGSYNSEIKTFVKGKFFQICLSIRGISKENKNNMLRIWLFLCLAKTIKEQTGITDSLPGLDM